MIKAIDFRSRITGMQYDNPKILILGVKKKKKHDKKHRKNQPGIKNIFLEEINHEQRRIIRRRKLAKKRRK